MALGKEFSSLPLFKKYYFFKHNFTDKIPCLAEFLLGLAYLDDNIQKAMP